MFSLNLSFQRILQGSFLPTVLKPLGQFFFFLLIFISTCTQAYAFTLSGTVNGGGTPLSDATLSLTDRKRLANPT
jgi:hypothetical protein